MSQKGFEQFKQEVLADETLQASIRDIQDRAQFIQAAADLAVEHGFDVAREDVEDAFRLGHRAWIERWI